MLKLKEAFTLWGLLVIDESHIDNSSNLSKFNSLLKLPFSNQKKLDEHLKDEEKFETDFLLRYPEIEVYFKKDSDTLKKQILRVAKTFILEGLIQMYKRIPFNNNILNDCQVFQLTEFDKEKFVSLAKHFKNIIPSHSLSKLQNELDILEYNFSDMKKQKEQLSHENVLFWTSLRAEYPLICKLALAVLTLPYSTACVERTFSLLKDIKDVRRNRLSSESVEACVLIHDDLGNMENFFVTSDMIQKYSKMWNNSQKSPEKKERKFA